MVNHSDINTIDSCIALWFCCNDFECLSGWVLFLPLLLRFLFFRDLLVSSWFAVALCSVTTSLGKNSLSIFLTRPLQKLKGCNKCRDFSRLSNSHSFSLSSEESYFSPVIITVALLWSCCDRSMSLLCSKKGAGFQSWRRCFRWNHHSKVRGSLWIASRPSGISSVFGHSLLGGFGQHLW